jgi:hypothetical protein
MEITEIMLKSQKYGDLALDVMRYQPMSETYVCQIIADDNGDYDWLLVDKHNIEIEHGDEMYLYTDTADYVSGGNFVQPVNNDRENDLLAESLPTNRFTWDNYEKFYQESINNNLTFATFNDFANHFDIQGFRFCPKITDTNKMKQNKNLAKKGAKRLKIKRGVDFADIILEYRNAA